MTTLFDDGSPASDFQQLGAMSPPYFESPDPLTESDVRRLTGQILRVYEAVKNGQWHTLRELASATGDPEPSISSQLRHLRKRRWGSHKIERRHVGNGLYQYRLAGEQP